MIFRAISLGRHRGWAAPSSCSPLGQAPASPPKAPSACPRVPPTLQPPLYPISGGTTSLNASHPRARMVSGRLRSSAPSYQVPPEKPSTVLSPVSSSVRDQWLCPLHRAVVTWPVGALIMAGPTPSPPLAQTPFSFAKMLTSHPPNLHILPLLPRPLDRGPFHAPHPQLCWPSQLGTDSR